MKECKTCKQILEYSFFYTSKITKDGYRSSCKKCLYEKNKEYYKKNVKKINEAKRNHYKKNRDVFLLKKREYANKNREKINYQASIQRIKDKEKINERQRIKRNSLKNNYEFRKKENKAALDYYYKNKEKILLRLKEYRLKNKELINERKRKNYRNEKNKQKRIEKYSITKNNPSYKINNSMKVGIYQSLKNKKDGISWTKLVNYSLDELIKHLEKQFTEEMSWDNYGSYWHIDHIIPLSAHNIISKECNDFKRAWDLKNLRPLKAFDNLSKNNKLYKPFQPTLF